MIAQFELAVKLNANFAPAYSGLSDAYLWAAFNEGVITRRKRSQKHEKLPKKPCNSTQILRKLKPLLLCIRPGSITIGLDRRRVSPGVRAESELRVRARSIWADPVADREIGRI